VAEDRGIFSPAFVLLLLASSPECYPSRTHTMVKNAMKITPEDDRKLTESLKRFRYFGMSILQAMALIATVGAIIIVLYLVF